MKWCPKCKRHGLEYDSHIGHEICLWLDCHFVNEEDIDTEKAFEDYIIKTSGRYHRFAKFLEDKKKGEQNGRCT